MRKSVALTGHSTRVSGTLGVDLVHKLNTSVVARMEHNTNLPTFFSLMFSPRTALVRTHGEVDFPSFDGLVVPADYPAGD